MRDQSGMLHSTVSDEAALVDNWRIYKGTLRRELSSFEVILLTLSCGSPLVNIYIVGGDVLHQVGTGAAGAFMIGLTATVVWVTVYAELASVYPYAGGDYVAVGSILGSWAGFAILASALVTFVPGIALSANFIAQTFDDLTTLSWSNEIAISTVLAATLIAILTTRVSAIVTGIFLLIELLTIILLAARGLMHPMRALGSMLTHPLAIGNSGNLAVVPRATIALGCVTAIYATIGGNQAIFFGEELKEPHSNMGRVVLIAGLLGAVAIAVPVIAVLVGAVDLRGLLRSSTPFNSFVSSFAGPMLASTISACVALAIFNAMIVSIMASARMLLSIGRDGVFPAYISRQLAVLHRKSGVPRTAALAICCLSIVCCFVPMHFLVVFIQGQVSFGFAFVCIAVLVGRAKGLTGKAGCWRLPAYPLIPLIGLGLAIAFWVVDYLDVDVGRPSILIMTALIICSILWYYFVLRRRPGGWSPRPGTG